MASFDPHRVCVRAVVRCDLTLHADLQLGRIVSEVSILYLVTLPHITRPMENGSPNFFEIAWEMDGPDYASVLASLHAELRPNSYLEVGTQGGSSLAISQCRSLAIDPQFRIDRDITGTKPACLLFQMTSDEFFASHDPKTFLCGPIDLAFLDGMHHFEFLLRDFINVERHSGPGSSILLHDCIPTDSHVGRRDCADMSLAEHSKHADWWAGDVWKTVLILLEHRPDLEITAIPSPPTGLIRLTNLDPSSSVLSRYYNQAVESARRVAFVPDVIARYLARLRRADAQL